MSKLYGTLSGDGRAASRTRCAHRAVTAAVQSWEGSVTVEITVDATGAHHAAIRSAIGSTAYGGKLLWWGDLAELVNARALTVTQ